MKPAKNLECFSLPKIECVTFGEGFLLYSPQSGALLLTNIVGEVIYRAMKSGRNAEQTIACLIERLAISDVEASEVYYEVVSGWKEAGLFRPTREVFENPVTYNPAKVPQDEFMFEVEDSTIHVVSTNQIVASQMREIMQDYLVEKPAHMAQATLALQDCQGGIGVFLDEQPVWECCNTDLARNLALREVATHLCGEARLGALLHAGGVYCPKANQSLLITNVSGSGKSTLTAGLLDAGLTFMADDLLPLHRDGRRLVSFPAALGLKCGSWNLPEVNSINSPELSFDSASREGVRYYPVNRKLPLGEAVKAAAIIIPNYQEAAETRCEKITPETALHRVIEAGGRTMRRNPTMLPLATLLNELPCYELHYSSSQEAVASVCSDYAKPSMVAENVSASLR